MLNIILSSIVLVVFSMFYFIYKRRTRRFRSKKKMNGKVVLITGGSSGIGKYAALDLAKRNAKIIFPCRNVTKGQQVADWIREKSGNNKIFVSYLDTSDLISVDLFCKQILKSETKIDVLINNAGCANVERKLSPQGYELTLATNHLGHFLLTLSLMELLKNSECARIINVSSGAHKNAPLDLNDLHFERRDYTFWKSYAQSKLANVLFTNELARRLKVKGIRANSLHPGIVATSIASRESSFLNIFINTVMNIFGRSPEDGAQTTIYLAVSDDVANISGEFFIDCKVAQMSSAAQDENLARELWSVSEKLVGVRYPE